MYSIQSSNQNNVNFGRIYRMAPLKNIKRKCMLGSFLGIWSCGAFSGYRYGARGLDAFKPSTVEKEVVETKQTVESKTSSVEHGIKEKVNTVKQFFSKEEKESK